MHTAYPLRSILTTQKETELAAVRKKVMRAKLLLLETSSEQTVFMVGLVSTLRVL